MRGLGQLLLILAVALPIAIFCGLGLQAATTPTQPESLVRTLTELDKRAERRHQELLVKIETLRRQAVALLGGRRIQ